ncbi:MAG TPA: FliH/SctL family protein [Bryobacteraceae bacterium]|nr:FliH/SctL family protein [Bryobacteraceae bacterium]
MLCKVATRPEDAKPIVLRQLPRSSGSAIAPLRSDSQAEVAELQRQISELRAAHHTELAQVKQNAFQEGLRQGREEANSAIQDSTQKLGTTLADLGAFKRKLRLEAEREVVKLSLAIGRRILNRELATDPDALQGVIHAALSKLQNRDIWQVRVSLQAVDLTRACLDRAGLADTVKVVADPTLQPGDLLIDTPSGELDASVNTQLHEIERGFAERLAIR